MTASELSITHTILNLLLTCGHTKHLSLARKRPLKAQPSPRSNQNLTRKFTGTPTGCPHCNKPATVLSATILAHRSRPEDPATSLQCNTRITVPVQYRINQSHNDASGSHTITGTITGANPRDTITIEANNKQELDQLLAQILLNILNSNHFITGPPPANWTEPLTIHVPENLAPRLTQTPQPRPKPAQPAEPAQPCNTG